MNHRLLFSVLLFALSGNAGNLGPSPVIAESRVQTGVLPDKLSDHDFWTMLNEFSEPGGTFVSDNIISNEIEFQRVIPDVQRLGSHNVYVGVGPEQNFTYIVAFKPSMAFIVDIRKGNLLLHLTYKALVETSSNRVEFMSRLFARQQPSGVGPNSTARELFRAFGAMEVSKNNAMGNYQQILHQLEIVNGFTLSEDDERGIAEVYRSFYNGGPFVRGDFGGGTWIPSYAELMEQTDLHGFDHSFLQSEQNFQILKDYEARNLVVPLVGDFVGPRTIRMIGEYVRENRTTVDIFYTSNVEKYLFEAGTERRFYLNVSGLPIAADGLFIRTFFTHTDSGLNSLLDPIALCVAAVNNGEVRSYTNFVSRSKAPAPWSPRLLLINAPCEAEMLILAF
jgi:hypothetical protein